VSVEKIEQAIGARIARRAREPKEHHTYAPVAITLLIRYEICASDADSSPPRIAKLSD
jgi:hypothetical protein